MCSFVFCVYKCAVCIHMCTVCLNVYVCYIHICTYIYVCSMCMHVLCVCMHACIFYSIQACVSAAYMCVLCTCICTQGLRTVHPDQSFLCSSYYQKASDIFVQQSLACSDHTNHLIQPQLEAGRHTAHFSQHPKQKATSFPPPSSQPS